MFAHDIGLGILRVCATVTKSSASSINKKKKHTHRNERAKVKLEQNAHLIHCSALPSGEECWPAAESASRHHAA